MVIPADKALKGSKLPLRAVFVIPFLPIALSVLAVGWLSHRNGQQAVNDLALQLQHSATEQVQGNLTHFLEVPHLINQLNGQAVLRGELTVQDEASERYLWHQIQLFPDVSWIYFGSEPEGAFNGVFREKDGIQIVINDKSSNFSGYYFKTNNQGHRLQRVNTINVHYDARQRPWYQKAVAARSAAWSEIFPDLGTEPRLTMSATLPVFNKTGQLLGVSAVDYYLDKISSFLQQLKVTSSSQLFILERSGFLVASSTLKQPFIINPTNQKPERIRVINLSESSLQAITKELIRQTSSLQEVQTPLTFSTVWQRQRQLVQVTPFQDGRGLDWIIVLAIPESDFMNQIQVNSQTTLLLSGLAILFALGIGLLAANQVLKPLIYLGKASQAMAMGHLKQKLEPNRIYELDVLRQSFNFMAKQINESVGLLEHRVEQRTTELLTANNEISKLNERLQEENLRMGSELEVTRKIQRMILPKDEELNQIPGLEISGFMESAAEVGGDYYDVLLDHDRVKIGIGDVTGHGLESGMLMLMVQMAVRTLLASQESNPSQFLSIINQAIYGNVNRLSTDKNMTLSLLDYHQGKLHIVGQHEEIIVVRSQGDIERFDTIDLGFPIGLEPEIGSFIDKVNIELGSGDVVVLYTDGITEAENQNSQLYGVERLCQVALVHRHESATLIRQAIIADVLSHIDGHVIYDDITLLILKQL